MATYTRTTRITKLAGITTASTLAALAAAGVQADTKLYDNGADAFTYPTRDSLNASSVIADEFTLSAAATLDRVTFAEFTLNFNGTTPAVPQTIKWCIGTSAFGSSVGCGTATITPTATGTRSGSPNYFDFSSSFDLPSLSVAAGTYFLSLTDGTDTISGHPTLPHNNDYWANTAATSGDALGGSPTGGTSSSLNSEMSFQIYGTVANGGGGGGGTSVPEPQTALLLTSGLLSLALSRRRPRGDQARARQHSI